ncbi:MAG: benzoylformate decarboxylase [Mycobacterium sp.]|nr:benzoylformate decarboxylase [Mycobacterium sp.]
MGDGSIQYAITSLWTAARYGMPLTIVVASNSEYGILKEFGAVEHTAGVPGLDLPGLDIVATARSYGVDAHKAKTTDDAAELLNAGIADRARPHPDQYRHHTRRRLVRHSAVQPTSTKTQLKPRRNDRDEL